MISEAEVRRIAALAKLELEPAELERMQHDLGRILDFVDQIGRRGGLRPPGISVLQVQGSGRPQGAPTVPADEPDNAARSAPLRPDDPRPSLEHDDVAANAPRFVHGHFVVPRILGGE